MSLRYYFLAREMQHLEMQAVTINRWRNAAQVLANEALEYSKRNATILPVLQQFMTLPKAAAPSTTSPPATKAAGK
jgi:hypothetical protein